MFIKPPDAGQLKKECIEDIPSPPKPHFPSFKTTHGRPQTKTSQKDFKNEFLSKYLFSKSQNTYQYKTSLHCKLTIFKIQAKYFSKKQFHIDFYMFFNKKNPHFKINFSF